ncbi:MAG: hypothetical protein HN368_08935 [Spirochaetales bacterium]|jgi:activator of HSP90 ATPase|nr:hypothetical protein [Spirochaetales bacterium]
MPVTIKQKVKFTVPPGKLYRFYTDSKLHSELIGGKARISTEAGASFSAYGGSLKGKTLLAKKNSMFVQTWRSSDWPKEDMDSVLILIFRPIDTGTELEMIHANVPDSDAADVKNGWNQYYWNPWKAYIKG